MNVICNTEMFMSARLMCIIFLGYELMIDLILRLILICKDFQSYRYHAKSKLIVNRSVLRELYFLPLLVPIILIDIMLTDSLAGQLPLVLNYSAFPD